MNFLTKIMNMIRVNDVSYEGRNVVIKNNRVIIDGKDVTPENDKNISIVVDGGLDWLNVDYARVITINGDVRGTLSATSGDVTVMGSVQKDVVTSSGDIEIGGNVGAGVQTTSGDVEVEGSVNGGIRTVTGDVTHG